jgi:hypothetical protein
MRCAAIRVYECLKLWEHRGFQSMFQIGIRISHAEPMYMLQEIVLDSKNIVIIYFAWLRLLHNT